MDEDVTLYAYKHVFKRKHTFIKVDLKGNPTV